MGDVTKQPIQLVVQRLVRFRRQVPEHDTFKECFDMVVRTSGWNALDVVRELRVARLVGVKVSDDPG